MKYLLYCLLLLAFTSCEVKVNSASTDKKKEEPYTRNTNKIRNGIKFTTTGGLKVEQAFLSYEDGTLVDEQNITDLKRRLVLHLNVDGWKAENGKVYIDAEQKVLTDEGQEILNVSGLFTKNGIEAVSEDEAKQVSLNVVINSINRLVDYFLVEFKVYNRKSEQVIEGSYKFHINKM
jgi:hypothetical protein